MRLSANLSRHHMTGATEKAFIMASIDEVKWAFRYCFGREPESDATIQAHMGFGTWKDLRAALLKTDEFQNSVEIRRILHKWVMTPVMSGQRVMWIDLGDRYVSHACLMDDYEPIETAFVKKHLKEGDNFLDIGANVGWFSVLASTIVGDGGSISAFEPRGETGGFLEKTILANNLGKMMTLHKCGLSNARGIAYINSSIDTDNPGGSFVTDVQLGDDMESHRIELQMLDSFNLGKVDFIKMDVEGSEMKAVLGGRETILRSRPIILSEINPIALENVSGVSANDYISYMIGLGYEISIIDNVRGGEVITRYPADWGRDLINVGMFPR